MEMTWLFKVDMTEVRARCTKLFVQIAKKSAKFPSNPEKIVRFIAENVFQSTRMAGVKKEKFFFSVPNGNSTIKPLTPDRWQGVCCFWNCKWIIKRLVY